MSGGKGGSQTTEVQIPDYLETPIQQNIAMAQDMARIGYVPYYGPDVAGFSPMQQAAFANTNQAAQAFGMQGVSSQGGGVDPYTGMPALAPGQTGYSSGDVFDQSRAELQRRRPGQYSALESFFIDPNTPDPSTVTQSGGKGGGQTQRYETMGARDEFANKQAADEEEARKAAERKAVRDAFISDR